VFEKIAYDRIRMLHAFLDQLQGARLREKRERKPPLLRSTSMSSARRAVSLIRPTASFFDFKLILLTFLNWLVEGTFKAHALHLVQFVQLVLREKT
jgi:hypothetical protein